MLALWLLVAALLLANLLQVSCGPRVRCCAVSADIGVRMIIRPRLRVMFQWRLLTGDCS